MEEKKLETNTEQNLPVQELPADIPAEDALGIITGGVT